MITMDEATKIIKDNCIRREVVSIEPADAYGMVIAEDVLSDIDIPPFDKSAMDGYALRASDVKVPGAVLAVKGVVSAGTVYNDVIKSGECVKIMTGAPVPDGADAVVMVEHTEISDDTCVRIMKSVWRGKNICIKGEDVKCNMVVLRDGSLIQGTEIAIFASLGRTTLKVYRKPEIAVISTGDELVEPDAALEPGKIRNSNSTMLVSMLASSGYSAEYLGIAPDNEKGLRRLIKKGLGYDVLLISGGVSMGDYDIVPEILQDEGVNILFHRVMVKPGKPLLFGKKGMNIIFGIPGNPVSNFTSFHVFIKGALYLMTGINNYSPCFIKARITSDYKNTSKRLHIIPSRYTVVDGKFTVKPFKLRGSADIIGCAGSNCLMFVDKDTEYIPEGEDIKILLLD